ncbi:ATP-binding cassette domain-containing protein [Desulfohalovibrio reitneri]|uniref:ATP-binding cassette domain-containing protein n=1 Tax=Desulfohalovibrio reitneri TaxID=1307759 RepID=UPI00068E7E83|nr:ATP-binding cassette domain-containing protein [Desulfohalovibrio reitneri]
MFHLRSRFTVEDHALVLFGPSGSGKTLTLQAIAGLLTPDEGSIWVNGAVLFDSSAGVNLPARKREVGYVFQDYALFPHRSVRENVGFGVKPLLGRLDRESAVRVEAAVRSAAEAVNLDPESTWQQVRGIVEVGLDPTTVAGAMRNMLGEAGTQAVEESLRLDLETVAREMSSAVQEVAQSGEAAEGRFSEEEQRQAEGMRIQAEWERYHDVVAEVRANKMSASEVIKDYGRDTYQDILRKHGPALFRKDGLGPDVLAQYIGQVYENVGRHGIQSGGDLIQYLQESRTKREMREDAERLEMDLESGDVLFQSPATIRLDEMALPANEDVAVLREEAGKHYMGKLAGMTVNHPDLGEIVFRARGGWKKFRFMSADPVKLRVVPALPWIVRTAKPLASAPSTKDKGVRFHYLGNRVSLGGEAWDIQFTVSEDKNGQMTYDLIPVKKKDLPGIPPRGSQDGKATAHPTGPLYQGEIVPPDDGVNIALTQAKEKGFPSGATIFGENGQAIINFFETWNASTPPHEIMHVYRRILEDMASHDSAPEWVRDAWTKANEFVGATPGEAWTTEQEEAWARAGEAYLREGRPPSEGLRGAFRMMRKWLVQIYRTIMHLDVKLTPEIREVFDRMLATEEEIQAAKEGMEFAPMLERDEAADEYIQAAQAAEAVADEAIERRVEDELAEKRKEWRRQAKQEADGHPAHQVIDSILDAGGIDAQDLGVELVVDGRVIKKINKLRPSKRIIREGGAEAWRVAEQAGFDSVAEMVDYISRTPTKRQIIADRMEELEAEWRRTFNPEVEILSDRYEDLLEKEAQVLAGATKGRPVKSSAIKKLVRQRTGQMKSEYIAMSEMDLLKSVVRREARAARRAYSEGKKEAAAAAKDRQRRALAELRERYKAKQELLKIIRGVRKEAKSKSVPWEWQEQVLSLVERFGMGTKTLTPRRPEEMPKLVDFLRGKMDFLYDPDLLEGGAQPPESGVADWIVEASKRGRWDYRDLTLDQTRDLYKAVRWLAHRGRIESRLISAQEQAAVQAVAQESADNMADLGEKHVITEKESRSIFGKTRKFSREMLAELGLMEYWLKAADGFRKGSQALSGPLYRHMVKPLTDARAREFEIWEDFGRRMDEILQPVVKDWGKDKGFTIDGVALPEDVRKHWDGLWTKQKIFMLALNLGNEGNRNAVKKGYGHIDKATGKFREMSESDLSRIVSHLTEAEWDAVEQIWQLVDELFPMIDETHYQINGTKLTKVDPEPFYTPSGRLVRGGYFPLIFDRAYSRKARQFQEAEDLMNSREALYQKPNPKSGMTKERQGGTLPPRLSITVIPRHMSDAIHYSTHAVAVRDAYKLISEDTFAQAFTRHFGDEAYNLLTPWLRYIARPERERGDAFEDLMEKMRNRASVVVLGFNPKYWLIQVSGLAHTMKELGAARTAKAAMSIMRHRGKALDWGLEKSTYLRNRANNFDREIQGVFHKLDPTAGHIEVFGRRINLQDVREFSLKGIQVMDMAVAHVTYHAAYEQAMAEYKEAGRQDLEGMDHDASRYADDVIRQSQASADPFSLSHFQRSRGLKRLLVMFFTFTQNYLNRQGHHIRGWREGKMSNEEFARHVFFEWFLPPMVESALLGAVLAGEVPWADEPERLLKEFPYWWVSGLPIVRNVRGVVEYGSDISDTPALQGFDALVGLGATTKNITAGWLSDEAADDGQYLRWLRHAAESVGFMVGVPYKPIFRFQKGLENWMNDETRNPIRFFINAPEE